MAKRTLAPDLVWEPALAEGWHGGPTDVGCGRRPDRPGRGPVCGLDFRPARWFVWLVGVFQMAYRPGFWYPHDIEYLLPHGCCSAPTAWLTTGS